MIENGAPIAVPPERARAAQEIASVLAPGRRVVLITHVAADGDGVGSEVALCHLLAAQGMRVSIANPSPIPGGFDFSSLMALIIPTARSRRSRGRMSSLWWTSPT